MKRLTFFSAVLASVLSAGCLTDSDSVAGIEGTGSPATVSGSVTAYGSIYVNGIHIDIDSADVSINGAPASLDEIRLGMVVDVEADSLEGDDATAQQVRYDRSLRGDITELVAETETRRELRILGQTLIVQDDIQLDGLSFDGLDAGITVDVSGFLGADGRWTASRIARAEPGAAPDLRGPVSELDSEARQFNVSDLRIDYSGAEVTGGELSPGQSVRVSGGEIQDQVLFPARVEILDGAGPVDGATLLKEGVVGRFVSRSEFDITGVTVDASGATIEGSPDDLASGVRVSIRGQVDGGVLLADKVVIMRPGIHRIRAMVDDINPQTGELTLLGTTYQSNGLTAFEDRSGGLHQRLNIGALNRGDRLEVYAFFRGEELVVTRVKRLQSGSEGQVDLRGPVTDIDVDGAQVRVMGVSVSLAGASGAELIADLELGDQVLVSGQMTGSQAMSADTIDVPDFPDEVPDCPPPQSGECEDVTSVPTGIPLSSDDMSLRF